MKLVLLSSLLLIGCAQGYSVGQTSNTVCDGKQIAQTTYFCKEQKPFLFYDKVVKLCNSLDECNNFCAEMNVRNR